MAKVVILGSSSAVAYQSHENTHMVIMGRDKNVLVDCPTSPVLRLEQAGLDFNRVTDIIITHFHPDHVSGLPNFLMEMWLMGRKDPVNIYGLEYTLDRVEKMMGLFEWKNWPDFYPVSFVRLDERELYPVLSEPEFKVYSSPVKHLIPNVGLRAEFTNGKIFAYSSDTEPCGQVVRLAAGADTLVHEASGAFIGHSSADQAGQIAEQAGVSHLYLIHYPDGAKRTSAIIDAALLHFRGKVDLAEDFTTLQF